jgi:hypothetical protein
VAGATLAATGFTSSSPRTGRSSRTWALVTRCACTWPRPKRSFGTPTTALVTFTFWYTLILVTLTVVLRLTTTLLTTRGPPQPRQEATPTKPGRPHHGMTGSPQQSGAQKTGRPTLTVTPPRKTTSAGA